MSITVNFFTFSKRDNSTAQPSGSGTSLNCKLRFDCSILTPQLQLTGPISNPSSLNYAYISDFGRYYWVTDWSYDTGFWNASLKVDVLATYKTAIGTSSLYVLRSASAYNQYLNDAQYPTRSDGYTTTSQGSALTCIEDSNMTLNGGSCYVIGIQNGDSYNNGGINYYAMSNQAFANLLTFMFDTATFLNATDISVELQKELVNPMQYITSIMWLPFDLVSSSLTSARTLKFGYWTAPSTVYGYLINRRTISFSTSITLPVHPQAATKGLYMNSAPYTRHQLNFYSFGSIPIDPSHFVSAHNMPVILYVDLYTGAGKLLVSGPTGNVIYRANGMVGAPSQVSQVTQNIVSAGLSVVGGAVGLAYGNVVGYAQGIISGIENIMPQRQTTGAVGSSVDWETQGLPMVTTTFYSQSDSDVTNLGRPLCERRQISTLSGYVVVENGDIDSSATLPESNDIRAYLEGGFFYE